jgi:quercetin dioxygenase-like cupin family protein
MSGTNDSLSVAPVAVDTAEIEPEPVGDGIVRRDLLDTGRARGWIIDFAPGTEWPVVDHHDSEERYFVLSGEVIDGVQRYGPGTYVVFPPGSRHRPRTDQGASMLGINIAVCPPDQPLDGR